MSAIWDGDTGTVNYTATKDDAPVNLTGAECTLIVRDTKGVGRALVTTVPDPENGKVVGDGGPLEIGTYDLVLKTVRDGVTITYPSADKGPAVLLVVPSLDATL